MCHDNDFMALHRIRQAPVEAGPDGRVVFTELGDNGLLPLLHNEKASPQPDQHGDPGNQTSAYAGAFHVRLKAAIVAAPAVAITARAAAGPGVFGTAKQATKLAVEIAPEFVKVRRALVRAFGLRRLVGLLRGRRGSVVGLGFLRS